MAQVMQNAKTATKASTSVAEGKQEAKTITNNTANMVQGKQEAKKIVKDTVNEIEGKHDPKMATKDTANTGQVVTTAHMAKGKHDSSLIKNEITVSDTSNAASSTGKAIHSQATATSSNDPNQVSMPQSPERKIRERREGYGEIEQYHIELIKQKRARIHDDTQKHRVRKSTHVGLKKEWQKNRREEVILRGKIVALEADLVSDEELGAANRKQFELLDRQERELAQEWTKYYNLQRDTAPSYECLKDEQSKQK